MALWGYAARPVLARATPYIDDAWNAIKTATGFGKNAVKVVPDVPPSATRIAIDNAIKRNNMAMNGNPVPFVRPVPGGVPSLNQHIGGLSVKNGRFYDTATGAALSPANSEKVRKTIKSSYMLGDRDFTIAHNIGMGNLKNTYHIGSAKPAIRKLNNLRYTAPDAPVILPPQSLAKSLMTSGTTANNLARQGLKYGNYGSLAATAGGLLMGQDDEAANQMTSGTLYPSATSLESNILPPAGTLAEPDVAIPYVNETLDAMSGGIGSVNNAVQAVSDYAVNNPVPVAPPVQKPAVHRRAPVRQARPQQARPQQARPQQARPQQARLQQARPQQARPQPARGVVANPIVDRWEQDGYVLGRRANGQTVVIFRPIGTPSNRNPWGYQNAY